MKTDVTIIIPVYNVAPYIEACLQSVMRQSYAGPMECLIVDDCGTDDSVAIAEQMIAKYVGPIQFRVLHHAQTRGLSAARNTGTMSAVGDYLFYLDSDDEITEDCIEKLMGKVEEYPDLEMVQGNLITHTFRGEEILLKKEMRVPMVDSNEEARQCYFQLHQMRVMMWNKILKREFIIRNNLLCKEGVIYEDTLWTFHLLKCLKKAFFVSDVTYHYLLRPNSICTGIDKYSQAKNQGVVYREILSELSPGFERQEINHYVDVVGRSYVKYSLFAPEINDAYQMCMEKGRLYGNWQSRVKLALFSLLGKSKIGPAVLEIIKRIKHPRLILRGLKRWCLKMGGRICPVNTSSFA